MFIEFFSRAVTAGLISESQKNALMDFAKTQPVTSFVANRGTAGGAESGIPAAALAHPATEPAPHTKKHREPWLSSVFLAVICLLIGAWAAGFDGGPLGSQVRDAIAAFAMPTTSVVVE